MHTHANKRCRPGKIFSLPLAWTLLTVSLWTSGSCHQDTLKVLYPKITSTEHIECVCVSDFCDTVYWFRIFSNHNKAEYLGRLNNADMKFYEDKTEKNRFKFSKSGSSFKLRITNVTEEDTGIYSCVLKDRRNQELWKCGTLLLPGVPPPTLPPKTITKKSQKSVCSCTNKKRSQKGCGSLVLWPLVGVIVGLALAVICTLYYFSRLPKKCRHQFMKKRSTT